MIAQPLAVTFGVPQHVIEGLKSGAYERVGGVVRHVAEKGHPRAGQVVCWLRETSGLRDQLAEVEAGSPLSLPVEAQEALTGIGAQLQAIGALQVLNLGVSVAGFALVMHRLNRIDEKLSGMIDELRAIRQEVEWIGVRADFDPIFKITAAAEIARMAEVSLPAREAAVEYREARRVFTASRAEIAVLIRLLVSNRQHWERPHILDLYVRLQIAALCAEIRTALLLDQHRFAVEASRAGRADIRATRAVYDASLGTPLTAVREGRPANLDSHKELGRSIRILDESVRILDGYEAEIEFLKANNIDYRDWQALSDGFSEVGLLCIPNPAYEVAA